MTTTEDIRFIRKYNNRRLYDGTGDAVDGLKELLAKEDSQAVWAWFKRYFPKCMELVPARRREQFVAGVQKTHEDDRNEV